MTVSGAERRSGRHAGEGGGQDELFEKSQAEELEARRGQPVECLGLTFENDETRRAHFLGSLRDGLEELHDKLGGVPYAGLDDTVARMPAIEPWPMGDEAQLRGLAERMRHADSSKDLLQRWKDEVGFPHGEIEDILNLSDPPWRTACPNPFLDSFVDVYIRHETVNHSEEVWVVGDVHTNGTENAWSPLKRSIVGAFHKISEKHMDRYLEEFEWRFNNRKNPHIFMDALRRSVRTPHITYRELVGEAAGRGHHASTG